MEWLDHQQRQGEKPPAMTFMPPLFEDEWAATGDRSDRRLRSPQTGMKEPAQVGDDARRRQATPQSRNHEGTKS